MNETIVVPLAIVVVALAMGLSVVMSLTRAAPPAAAVRIPGVLPVSVLCPATGDVTLADMGFDWATAELAIASCERFPTGEFDCDRECCPTQVLVPTGAVG